MRSKTTSAVNSKSKRKTTKGSKIQIQDLDEILNEEIVTTTRRQRQPIRSPSSSHSKNKTTTTTNTNETASQAQPIDQTQPETVASPMKSVVWRYATKLQNGKAKCHNCNREIACKDHSTTGLHRHLHRCINISKFTSSSGNSFKSSVRNDVKKKLNELVFKCIIEDGRSFGDLRKPGITRLLDQILPGECKYYQIDL